MLETASVNGVKLRGQTKTHKTVEGGILQTGGTKRGIVTSTFVECDMYADAGFDDILYGFPFVPSHFEKVYDLTQKLSEFHLMVTNISMCRYISQRAPPPGKLWSLVLKIDCGNARAGVWCEDEDAVVEIVSYLQSEDNIKFQGIYTHCGNSYTAHSVEEVEKVRDSSMEAVVRLVERLKVEGLDCPTWGIGSTPSCSHRTDKFQAVTELHPGNYVFYDNQQLLLGSCAPADVAGKILTRVIGHYPRRGQMLVDCGFTAITKQGQGSQTVPSMIAPVQDHPELMLSNMTQEIGFVQTTDEDQEIDFEMFPIGTVLTLIPYHACASAACHEKYFLHDKEGIIEEVWAPCKGW